MTSASDLHTHRKSTSHTHHLWLRTGTEGRYFVGRRDSATICISGYLQNACRRLVHPGGPTTGQHRPRQSHCSGRDLWFHLMWPAGMEPSLVNLGCVWYELWGQGTGENDLRMDVTNTLTMARGGLWVQKRNLGPSKILGVCTCIHVMQCLMLDFFELHNTVCWFSVVIGVTYLRCS